MHEQYISPCYRHLSNQKSTYFPVHGTNNGRTQPHACHKANVEILLQNEGLHTGTNEQQGGVEVAMPCGGTWIIHKLDQQPKIKKTKLTSINEYVIHAAECSSYWFKCKKSGQTG